MLRKIAAALAACALCFEPAAAGPQTNQAQSTYAGPGSPGFLSSCSSTFAVTNGFKTSQGAFNGANWLRTGTPSGTAPTIVDNNATAPDGTQTASTISFQGIAAGTTGVQTLSPATKPTTNLYTYTYDIYIKGVVGGEVVYLSASAASTTDGTGYARTRFVATKDWQRASVSFSSAGTPLVALGFDQRDSQQTGAVAAEQLQIWGAQLTGGSYDFPYVPTTTAAVTQNTRVSCPPGVAFRDFSNMKFYAGNPIIPQNTGTYNAGGVSNQFFQPTAKINGLYYAFAFCTVSGTTAVRNAYNNLCLYSGTDPLTWTDQASINPVITSAAGTWKDHYLLHPSIAPFSCSLNTYCMYYSAMDTSNHSSIGVASSPDLRTWTDYASNPVIPATGSGGGVVYPSLPHPFQIGNTLYLYTAINNNAGKYLLYYTSPVGDGVNWTFKGTALNPPLPNTWDAATLFIIDPYVLKNRHGFYEMVYTADFTGTNTQQMGYAVSADGITWWRYEDRPIAPQPGYFYPIKRAIGDGVFYEDGTNFYFFWNYDDAVSLSAGNVDIMPDY